MFYAKTKVEWDSLGLSGLRQNRATSFPSPLKHGYRILVSREFLKGIPVLHLSTAIILTMLEKLLRLGLMALA
jgi:hypothetical protein